MTDSFFGFETDLQSLGAGSHGNSQLLTADIEEEEYDALNDETFGAGGGIAVGAASEDDWENAHEKLAELEKKTRLSHEDDLLNAHHQQQDAKHGGTLYGNFGNSGFVDDDLEHCISNLVMEDDEDVLDDPAIMNMSKSRPISMKPKTASRPFFQVSPPPPAILQSNHGSPSTKSIWTSPQRVENQPHHHGNGGEGGGGGDFSALLQTLQKQQQTPTMHHLLSFEDPSIVGIGSELPMKLQQQQQQPLHQQLQQQRQQQQQLLQQQQQLLQQQQQQLLQQQHLQQQHQQQHLQQKPMPIKPPSQKATPVSTTKQLQKHQDYPPPPPLLKAQTVDEIERNLLNQSPLSFPNVTDKSKVIRTLEEIERDMLSESSPSSSSSQLKQIKSHGDSISDVLRELIVNCPLPATKTDNRQQQQQQKRAMVSSSPVPISSQKVVSHLHHQQHQHQQSEFHHSQQPHPIRSSPVLITRMPFDIGGVCVSPPVYASPSPPSPSPVQKTMLSRSGGNSSSSPVSTAGGAPIVSMPYGGRLVPPQVGFQRHPLVVGHNQALLGTPIRFPPGLGPPTHMSPPGLVPLSGSSHNRSPPHHPRFVSPQVAYSAAAAAAVAEQQHHLQFRRAGPPPPPPHIRHPFLAMQQQNQIRSHMFHQQQDGPNIANIIPALHLANIMGRNRTGSISEEDEYAGLMTNKEKDWLIKIQMLQLQSSNPYLDDYYYTAYTMKKKLEKAAKVGSSNGREPKLLVVESGKMEHHNYQPTQYEGSLGKLQAVSVNFPRKIIDVNVVHPDEGGEPGNKELRKYRQVLLEIEKTYAVYLTIDDDEKKMAALPKEAQEPLQEKKKMSISSICSTVCGWIENDEKFPQVMTIRKGRLLMLRIISLLNKDQKHSVLVAVLKYWTQIMRRVIHEHVLVRFVELIRDEIDFADLAQLVEMGKALQNGPKPLSSTSYSSSPTMAANNRSHYIACFQNAIGVKVVEALLCRAERLQASRSDISNDLVNQWLNVANHIVDVLCSLPDSSIAAGALHDNVQTNAPTEVSAHLDRVVCGSSSFDAAKSELVRSKLKVLMGQQ